VGGGSRGRGGAIRRLIGASLATLVRLWGPPPVAAGEVEHGIRFVVDEELGRQDGGRAIRATLSSQVEELNGYYLASLAQLRVVIVAVDLVPIEEWEAQEVLGAMSREDRGFSCLFYSAAQLGADYTVAVTPHLELQGRPGCGRAYAVIARLR